LQRRSSRPARLWPSFLPDGKLKALHASSSPGSLSQEVVHIQRRSVIPAHWADLMTPRTILVSAAVLVLLLGIGIALAAAPLHKPYTTRECSAAYGKARTRADTVKIDLRRIRDDAGTRDNRRCGATRAVASQPGAHMLVP
jgi:hypothetical protein